MLLLPTGTGQCPGTAFHSSWAAGGSPFPPALHLGQPLWAETLQGQLGLCTALIPGLPQLLPHLQSTGKGWLGHGTGGSGRSWGWAGSSLGWQLLRLQM